MKWTSLRGADGVIGGDLVDQDTPFASRDKVLHLVCGYFLCRLALLIARWPMALGITLAGALLMEFIEGTRYRRYGYSRSFSDEPDGTDVVVTVLGGLLGVVL